MKRPMKIDPKRLVLSLPMLIVLMHDLSLPIQPSVKLNIHNQCSNVDLVSPIYFISDDLERHRPPDYEVYAGSATRFGFVIKLSHGTGGALIYRLQRRQPHESTKADKDTSGATHLLVVWEIYKFMQLYTDVLLVEHEKGFDWNKDNLKELEHRNINRFRLSPGFATETWLLDDNTALMTTFNIMNKDHILNITISEVERDNSARIPSHIDPRR
jgi:hypothetical protein